MRVERVRKGWDGGDRSKESEVSFRVGDVDAVKARCAGAVEVGGRDAIESVIRLSYLAQF